MSIIYLPAAAESFDDLKLTFNLLSSFEKRYETGIMLIIRGGEKGLKGRAKESQFKNFERLTKEAGELPVIVMVSNLPLTDLDFYHLPEKSVRHIKLAVDFASELPGKKGKAIATFHLNTLLTPEEWKNAGNNAEQRYKIFQNQFIKRVFPVLKKAADYAGSKRTELKVETTPVPEFGDMVNNSELNQLGNPYPIYSGRGFSEIRRLGIGIALDFSHTFTLYKASAFLEKNNERFFEIYKGLFPSDIKKIKGKSFRQEIAALQKGDAVHLNDSIGLFDPDRNQFHKEGVALGEGEIEGLPDLLRALAASDVRIVFEINESDHKRRINLKRSIDYFWQNVYGNQNR